MKEADIKSVLKDKEFTKESENLVSKKVLEEGIKIKLNIKKK